jgi:hypothetical protein
MAKYLDSNGLSRLIELVYSNFAKKSELSHNHGTYNLAHNHNYASTSHTHNAYLTAQDHYKTTPTAGTYSDNTTTNLSHSGKFKVPKITINADGHVSSATDVELTLPSMSHSHNMAHNHGTYNLAHSHSMAHSHNFASTSHTHDTYATKTYVDEKITSVLRYKGTIEPSTDAPTSIVVGDAYKASTAGTYTNYGNVTLEAGELVIATSTSGDWVALQTNWTAQDGTSALSWNTTVTLATIGGVTIDAKLPANPVNSTSLAHSHSFAATNHSHSFASTSHGHNMAHSHSYATSDTKNTAGTKSLNPASYKGSWFPLICTTTGSITNDYGQTYTFSGIDIGISNDNAATPCLRVGTVPVSLSDHTHSFASTSHGHSAYASTSHGHSAYATTSNLAHNHGTYNLGHNHGTYNLGHSHSMAHNHSDFTGATASADGARGMVIAATIGQESYFLNGDGTRASLPHSHS